MEKDEEVIQSLHY